MNFSGKLTSKIVIKNDFIRSDGTCAVYMQVFLNGKRKRFACNIAVRPTDFDKVKQRIKSSCKLYKDYNLLIEKMLADINKIEINYRLSNQALTLDKVIQEYKNPASRLDFVNFWEAELEAQKEVLNISTYFQQKGLLNKLKEYQATVYFYEITPEWFAKLKAWCKKNKGNLDITIAGFEKSFKKYLHIANKRGIVTPMDYSDIKIRRIQGNRCFLFPEEVQRLYKFYCSEFINSSYKDILARFLFSCFTGLRISDVQRLTPDNFAENTLFFTSKKTSKIQRIPLNSSAKKFINENVFEGVYSDQHINRELKEICKAASITKKVTFHVARHTFATNFLLSGGRIEHLQKLLGHSDIKETMIYVHIVESITDRQIHNMDEILTLAPPN